MWLVQPMLDRTRYFLASRVFTPLFLAMFFFLVLKHRSNFFFFFFFFSHCTLLTNTLSLRRMEWLVEKGKEKDNNVVVIVLPTLLSCSLISDCRWLTLSSNILSGFHIIRFTHYSTNLQLGRTWMEHKLFSVSPFFYFIFLHHPISYMKR